MECATLQNAYYIIVSIFAPLIAVQLYFQARSNKRDQIIAWKNSAHGLNEMAMQYPGVFRKVLYPRAKDREEVQKYTSAYSSLHALEVMYHMRKDEERQSDRLDIFLREYVESKELRDAWKVDAAQTAFTKEFQDKLNEVIAKNPLKDPPRNNVSCDQSNTGGGVRRGI